MNIRPLHRALFSAIIIVQCPHGQSYHQCPYCSGRWGGGASAQGRRSSGEMSWSECYAIGQWLKKRQVHQQEQSNVRLESWLWRQAPNAHHAQARLVLFLHQLVSWFTPVGHALFLRHKVNIVTNFSKSVFQRLWYPLLQQQPEALWAYWGSWLMRKLLRTEDNHRHQTKRWQRWLQKKQYKHQHHQVAATTSLAY